jgi:hypothetical protein
VSVPVQRSCEQFHYPTEVLTTITQLAGRRASEASNVACAYLAEVEAHLTLDALQFVATGVGIAEPAPRRAHLIAQIRAHLRSRAQH